LYIRQVRNSIHRTRIDSLEPVVLVLDTTVRGTFTATAAGIHRTFIEEWSYIRQHDPLWENQTSGESIYVDEVGGFVSFIPKSLTTEQEIQQLVGREGLWRVPLWREIEWSESKDSVFPSRCSRYDGSGYPWWVTLVLGAAEYAKSDVILVLPDGCELPFDVKRALHARRKTLYVIPLAKIDKSTRQRLQRKVVVTTRVEFKSEDEVWGGLVNQFGDKVNSFWR
jgi:hypothetical protein